MLRPPYVRIRAQVDVCPAGRAKLGGRGCSATKQTRSGGTWANRALPEAAACALVLAGLVSDLWLALLLPSFLRAALVVAVAVHGLGHAWLLGTVQESF